MFTLYYIFFVLLGPGNGPNNGPGGNSTGENGPGDSGNDTSCAIPMTHNHMQAITISSMFYLMFGLS